MRYENIWRKTLNENEKVEYEFSVAPKQRKLFLIMFVILGLVSFFMSAAVAIPFIIIGLLGYWYMGFTVYALTTKRVLIHTGWLSTKSTSINYDKIVEVSIDEPFLNRAMTDSGHLVIKTAGIGHDVILKNIETPYEVKKTLDRLSHQG